MKTGAFPSQPLRVAADLILRIFIAVNFVVLLLIFLHTQLGIASPIPMLGTKLNNPLAILLGTLFLLGVVNPRFREVWLNRLKRLVTEDPHRYYLFGLLLSIEVGLEIMWFLYPENFHWNLNAEQGYGTHFSTLQLYLLGIFVLIVARETRPEGASWKSQWPWYFAASLYFYIGLDDCVGIHENFIKWSQNLVPHASVFHFIHEWLWFYLPFILAVVFILIRFFLKQFKKDPWVLLIMFAGLALWVSVLLLEGLAKNIVDPISLDYSRLLIGLEEGSEMAGATLFLFGFSRFYRTERRGGGEPPRAI